MDLGHKTTRVLISAGASGIGLAVARAFVGEGARVHVGDIDAAALAALAKSDPAIRQSHCDMADRTAVTRLFDNALAALGGLDVLVNNVGIAGPTGRVDEINPEDWDRCVNVNLTGQYNATRLAVPHLAKSANASIVNFASVAGRLGFALRTPYAASKWAVIGFTKSLAIELGPLGIRCNAILPGIVAGDRIRRVFEAKAQVRGQSFAEVEAAALARTSMHTYVDPRQLADLILFITSPRGRTISGQALSVDGDLQSLE
jgi:NAD(P)-dependent dehydrogenase (short-subunit alcohol dehydrogenase family)